MYSDEQVNIAHIGNWLTRKFRSIVIDQYMVKDWLQEN